MTFRESDIAEKKRHTIKVLALTNHVRKVLYVSSIFDGSEHDYSIMKVCFDPTIPWFKDRTLRADLGFLGAPADYVSDADIRLPHKKPGRSKSNPHPRLTKAQKRANRDHSRIRVIVEHTIGGMTYFHCLMHRIRNQSTTLIDQFFGLAGGLRNYKISIT
jgi:hypothetical protein